MKTHYKTMLKVLLAITLSFAYVSTHGQTLTFGIVPQQSAKKLAKLWTPIMKHLSKETGHTIRFATAKNIPTFEKRCSEGAYDIAYMNPYHYVVFGDKPGYQALARQKNKKIKGIIVVPKTSNVTTLQQLAGETLAFPAPAAFAASILPRGELSKAGVEFNPKYVSSHDSVYLNVSKGFMPAGGGVIRTFNNTDPKVREQLKIMWTTDPYTPHAIATHPSMDANTRKVLLETLLAMNNSDSSMALLKRINFKGFEKAKHKDWDDVRGLGIESLVKPKY